MTTRSFTGPKLHFRIAAPPALLSIERQQITAQDSVEVQLALPSRSPFVCCASWTTIPKEIELKLRVAPEDVATLRTHPNFAGALGKPVSETLVSVYFDSDALILARPRLDLAGAAHRGQAHPDHQIGRSRHLRALGMGTAYRERPTEPCLCGRYAARAASHRRHSQCLEAGVRDPDRTNDLSPERRRHRHRHCIRQRTDRRKQFIVPGLRNRTRTQARRTCRACSSSRARSAISCRLSSMSKASPSGASTWSRRPRIAAEKAYEPELSAGTSAGRAFTLIARACLRQLLANESAAKKRNAEALHQMRIALRRLRAAISLFSDSRD